MKQVVGWVLILSAVVGFYWSFKLLADAPGSLVGILLLIPVMVAAMVGVNLAGSRSGEVPLPPPTELVGTSVRVTDSTGAQFLCGLYFVSPLQLNFVFPRKRFRPVAR